MLFLNTHFKPGSCFIVCVDLQKWEFFLRLKYLFGCQDGGAAIVRINGSPWKGNKYRVPAFAPLPLLSMLLLHALLYFLLSTLGLMFLSLAGGGRIQGHPVFMFRVSFLKARDTLREDWGRGIPCPSYSPLNHLSVSCCRYASWCWHKWFRAWFWHYVCTAG